MLVERLGLPRNVRLLIVNCDDLGLRGAVNEGCIAALDRGVATDATLMVPCPDAAAAAALGQGRNIGLHLTLNCEWEHPRWGPVTAAPSLRRPEGGMYRSVRGLLDNAEPADVARELRAQIEQALAWGVDVTHLDSHMYALHDHERFFGIYLDLAREYRLPVRLSGSTAAPTEFRRRAAAAGSCPRTTWCLWRAWGRARI